MHKFLIIMTLLTSSCSLAQNYELSQIEEELYKGELTPEAALEEFLDFRQAYPENSTVEVMIASLALEMERYELVEPALDAAKNKGAESDQWHFVMGKLARLRGQQDLVVEHFQKVLEDDPSNGLAFYFIAEADLQTGNYQRAWDLSQRAWELLEKAPAAASIALEAGGKIGIPEEELKPYQDSAELYQQ